MSKSSDGASGVVSLVPGNDFDAQSFVIRQALAKTRTNTLVQVISCTNDGGLSPVGFVDVKVLVQRMDGEGAIVDAGQINSVPYLRIQGGTDAIIMDPKPGDIGLASICDRDISAVVASKAPAIPASLRRHDMADALYLGGLLNGTPAQYIQFTDDGINLVSPTKVSVQAPEVDIAGVVKITGAALTHNGVNVGATHTHTGVTPGSGSTGLPQ